MCKSTNLTTVKCRHLIAASQIEVAVLVQCGVMHVSQEHTVALLST